ncbi:permease [Psychromonas sp. CNPT3]|uniref:SO_0444 family Cu/Zn efflux transporter n=1 Tax=Psychromonas sp. CNPT3 TaxID=314282 RepID=UPI00006E56B0|nr:SO_0444 family Cu/Zn efflux transporter [Psychromonas sp. CNPT3]AGH81335.1 permease [Psychromonas sp. CNPT3]
MLLTNFVNIFLDSAPWLLLGLLLAGMLKMFVPMQWMQKQLGGHGFKSIIKAAMLGAPLPLCSCGVIPAAIGLRRSGASKASTVSFLVSTPETGVDSITVSYVLLGPFMAIVRPIAAVLSAIVAGLLVGRDEELDEKQEKAAQASLKTPCSHNKVATEPTSPCCSKNMAEEPQKTITCCSSKNIVEAPQKTTPCCSSKKEPQTSTHSHQHANEDTCCDHDSDIAYELKDKSILHRIKKGLHFACTELVEDTTVWLLIGLFFAALVQTYVPTDLMSEWGDGIFAMLFMVVISIPMYICATASTPIAAGLLLAGISPGAVLVFMLAGPATNIATIGMVNKELGKRALGAYLTGVMSVALLSGLLVNYVVDNFAIEVMPKVGPEHALLPAVIVYTSGIVLAILMAKVIFDLVGRKVNKIKAGASS